MAEVAGWRARLGRFGIWTSPRRVEPVIAGAAERHGFGSVWFGNPSGDLALIEQALESSESIVVGTSIVNIWGTPPEQLAEAYQRVTRRYPRRFILGIGVGHPESAGAAATRPYSALVTYLDALDTFGVPREDVMLAALGPRVLRVGAERTSGVLPYLVTPDHTRLAREILGSAPLLIPEQRVVVDADREQALTLGRGAVARPYLQLRNYRQNLLRIGFTEEDLDGDGSDHLVERLVISGDGETISRRLQEHFDAGADHVAIQLITPSGKEDEAALARLSEVLGLGARR